MNDSSTPRLDMLRFARRIAVQQVEQIDRWIAAEERRETERRHGEQARPPPDWLIETGSADATPCTCTSAAATWQANAPAGSTAISPSAK
ncbi:hypothetical protein ACWGDS_45485 [Streptomyces sp. NPDC055059]|uniref:hypothetical protein n=1 Tax=Streptomyces sp. NPDC127172 TaxID=3345382 RepID=UPI0036360D8D